MRMQTVSVAWLRGSGLGASLGLLAGCAAPGFLPQDGPARTAVIEHATTRLVPAANGQSEAYTLVPLDQSVVERLQSADPDLRLTEAEVAPAQGAIGVGDVIAITIFEADSGGLFLPSEPGTRSGNFVTLPNQQVDASGTITVPFAGPLHVAGLTSVQVQRRIEGALGAQALRPQAIVTIAQRVAGPVSVLGEIAGAAHFALDPGGERVLGAIARAGGPKFPAYESMITLQREGATQRALLSDIAQDPTQNVELQAGDTLYVSHEPRYFLALGATGVNTSLNTLDRRVPFQDAKLSLADAIARAGGLQDDKANARAVFVYRMESPATLNAIGVAQPAGSAPDDRRITPTVFLLNLADPTGLFLAGRFAMRKEDVIFVSDAPAADLTKFLSLISLATGSTSAVRSTVQ